MPKIDITEDDYEQVDLVPRPSGNSSQEEQRSPHKAQQTENDWQHLNRNYRNPSDAIRISNPTVSDHGGQKKIKSNTRTNIPGSLFKPRNNLDRRSHIVKPAYKQPHNTSEDEVLPPHRRKKASNFNKPDFETIPTNKAKPYTPIRDEDDEETGRPVDYRRGLREPEKIDFVLSQVESVPSQDTVAPQGFYNPSTSKLGKEKNITEARSKPIKEKRRRPSIEEDQLFDIQDESNHTERSDQDPPRTVFTGGKKANEKVSKEDPSISRFVIGLKSISRHPLHLTFKKDGKIIFRETSNGFVVVDGKSVTRMTISYRDIKIIRYGEFRAFIEFSNRDNSYNWGSIIFLEGEHEDFKSLAQFAHKRIPGNIYESTDDKIKKRLDDYAIRTQPTRELGDDTLLDDQFSKERRTVKSGQAVSLNNNRNDQPKVDSATQQRIVGDVTKRDREIRQPPNRERSVRLTDKTRSADDRNVTYAPSRKDTLRSNPKRNSNSFESDFIPRHESPPRDIHFARPKKWTEDLKYPFGPERESASMNLNDLTRLDPGEFLNGDVVNLFLKYILSEKARKDVLQDSYLFNTYLYTTYQRRGKDDERDNFAGVKRWTSKVNLFKKKYIFVPINENYHWYLAIFCNGPQLIERHIAQLAAQSAENENEKEDRKSEEMEMFQQLPRKSPRNSKDDPKTSIVDISEDRNSPPAKKSDDFDAPSILILDSLGNKHPTAIRVLKRYFTQEAKDKLDYTISTEKIAGAHVKVPSQTNFYDCGVFMLHYVEEFVKDPGRFVRQSLEKHRNKTHELEATWNAPKDMEKKRREIHDEILKLKARQIEHLAASADKKKTDVKTSSKVISRSGPSEQLRLEEEESAKRAQEHETSSKPPPQYTVDVRIEAREPSPILPHRMDLSASSSPTCHEGHTASELHQPRVKEQTARASEEENSCVAPEDIIMPDAPDSPPTDIPANPDEDGVSLNNLVQEDLPSEVIELPATQSRSSSQPNDDETMSRKRPRVSTPYPEENALSSDDEDKSINNEVSPYFPKKGTSRNHKFTAVPLKRTRIEPAKEDTSQATLNGKQIQEQSADGSKIYTRLQSPSIKAPSTISRVVVTSRPVKDKDEYLQEHGQFKHHGDQSISSPESAADCLTRNVDEYLQVPGSPMDESSSEASDFTSVSTSVPVIDKDGKPEVVQESPPQQEPSGAEKTNDDSLPNLTGLVTKVAWQEPSQSLPLLYPVDDLLEKEFGVESNESFDMNDDGSGVGSGGGFGDADNPVLIDD